MAQTMCHASVRACQPPPPPMRSVLGDMPVADGIAVHLSHVDVCRGAFRVVCRAWRDAAERRADCTLSDVDAVLALARASSDALLVAMRLGLPAICTMPWSDFHCSGCGARDWRTTDDLDRTWFDVADIPSLWHAADDPDSSLDLCDECYATYDGPRRRFVDIVRGEVLHCVVAINNALTSDRRQCANVLAAPMRAPSTYRWPRDGSLPPLPLLRAVSSRNGDHHDDDDDDNVLSWSRPWREYGNAMFVINQRTYNDERRSLRVYVDAATDCIMGVNTSSNAAHRGWSVSDHYLLGGTTVPRINLAHGDNARLWSEATKEVLVATPFGEMRRAPPIGTCSTGCRLGRRRFKHP